MSKVKKSFLLFCSVLFNLYSCNVAHEPDDVTPTINQPAVANTSSSSFHFQLASRWAPIHYQDVDVTGSHGLRGKSIMDPANRTAV